MWRNLIEQWHTEHGTHVKTSVHRTKRKLYFYHVKQHMCSSGLEGPKVVLLTYCDYGLWFSIPFPDRWQDYTFWKPLFSKEVSSPSLCIEEMALRPRLLAIHLPTLSNPDKDSLGGTLSFASLRPCWELHKLWFMQVIHAHVIPSVGVNIWWLRTEV